MNVPEMTREEFAKKRRVQAIRFFVWLAVTVVAGAFHPVLWLVGIVAGWFIIDTGALTTYKKSRREIEWAKSVLAEDAESGSSETVAK